jgi:hypothetical protein
MGLAILVAQGQTASAALKLLRSKRWQAAPNDRQLAALLDFERIWTGHSTHLDLAARASVDTSESAAS